MFERLADEDFAYLTTIGRRSGKQHTIEIWFALHDGRIYMLSGGGDRADWVKNLRKTPQTRVRIGTQSASATARILRTGTKEDELARQLLDGKYQGWREGKRFRAGRGARFPSRSSFPRSAEERPVDLGPQVFLWGLRLIVEVRLPRALPGPMSLLGQPLLEAPVFL